MANIMKLTSTGLTIASGKSIVIGGNGVDDILISTDGASSSDSVLLTAGWINANVVANPMVANLNGGGYCIRNLRYGIRGQASGDTVDCDIWGISDTYYPSHVTSASRYGIKWETSSDKITYVGAGVERFSVDLNDGNIYIGGNVVLANNKYITSNVGCGVKLSTNGSIVNVTWTNMTWLTEEWDDDTMHSTTSNANRITIKRAGRYHINCVVSWQAGALGSSYLTELRKNGAVYMEDTTLGNTTWYPTNTISVYVECAVNDYFDIRVYHNAGGNKIIYNGQTKFQIQKVK